MIPGFPIHLGYRSIYIGLIAYAGFLLGNQYYLVRKYFVSVYHLVLLVLAIALMIWGIKWLIQRYLNHRG